MWLRKGKKTLQKKGAAVPVRQRRLAGKEKMPNKMPRAGRKKTVSRPAIARKRGGGETLEKKNAATARLTKREGGSVFRAVSRVSQWRLKRKGGESKRVEKKKGENLPHRRLEVAHREGEKP